jgi:hypothetical protein
MFPVDGLLVEKDDVGKLAWYSVEAVVVGGGNLKVFIRAPWDGRTFERLDILLLCALPLWNCEPWLTIKFTIAVSECRYRFSVLIVSKQSPISPKKSTVRD